MGATPWNMPISFMLREGSRQSKSCLEPAIYPILERICAALESGEDLSGGCFAVSTVAPKPLRTSMITYHGSDSNRRYLDASVWAFNIHYSDFEVEKLRECVNESLPFGSRAACEWQPPCVRAYLLLNAPKHQLRLIASSQVNSEIFTIISNVPFGSKSHSLQDSARHHAGRARGPSRLYLGCALLIHHAYFCDL